MESLSTLSTAQEYTDYYYAQLKTELNARGLQVSKVGLIGYMLHILGFTTQDIKQYFDTLFREAFIGTADRNENLTMHGSVFGYLPGLAKSAHLVGNFTLNLDALPTSDSNTSRTILIEDLKCKISSYEYKLDAKYVIKDGICQITQTSGEVTHVPFSDSNPTIPIYDMYQYEQEEYGFTVPYYIYGTYYSKLITLNNTSGSISDLTVSIQTADSTSYVDYEVRLIDYYTGSNEEVVFAKYLSNNKILLEIGSGIHGKYCPNSSIKVIAKITQGELGNVSKQSATPYKGTVRVYTTDPTTGTGLGSYTIPVGNMVALSVDYAEGGTDALDGEELRTAILEYIRSRNVLLSEQDFYDILKSYIPDFVLIFKKTHVVDNVIYCFYPFFDKYQVPITSQSISIKHSVFNPDNTCQVYKPTFTINNQLYISPFLYVVDTMMRMYKAYVMQETVSTYFTSIVNEDSDNTLETLPLTLYAIYNPTLDNTRFIIQSYQTITSWIFYVTIPELGITDQCMSFLTDNLAEFYYYDSANGTGIIFDTINIVVKAFKDGVHKFTYTRSDFSMVGDISDLLSLKTFDGFVTYSSDVSDPESDGSLQLGKMFADDAYVLNIPIMLNDTYSGNPDFYEQKFINTLSGLSTNNPRMLSDDVQIRFINTDLVDSTSLSIITKQAYNFDMQLPLLLTINIIGYKDKINSLNIDTTTAEDAIQLQLAQKLHDEYTGTSISFYQTQIIKIIQELAWVKSCSVVVSDSNSHILSSGNIETNSQKDIVDSLDKLQGISYCPVYFWWNVDNITINMTYE